MIIVSAAILIENTIISQPPPARHGHILQFIGKLDKDIFIDLEQFGFLTDTGKFVDRYIAKDIATKVD